MTRERIYGSDTEFCAWLRDCKELPSRGKDFGFVASDNDVTVHRYMTDLVDAVGTRDVQGIMQIEIKTRKGKPSNSQIDTLSKLNLFCGQKYVGGVQVRFFGVFVLILSGTNPDDSDNIWWAWIPKGMCLANASELKFKKIDRAQLIQLLRFEIHPRNFQPEAFRRHHLTREIIQIETTPLGFTVERRIIKRS